MEPNNDRQYFKVKKTVLLVAILILAAGITGWKLGSSDKKTSPQQAASPTLESSSIENDVPAVKSIASYRLPDGWKEASCPSDNNSVYILPAGSNNGLDCNANPSAPVKISIDPATTKDCSQLANPQQVKKHICRSVFINGKKTLQATTEYLDSSEFEKAISINAYYIDAGKEVVKLTYAYFSNNTDQQGFDELANSVKVK